MKIFHSSQGFTLVELMMTVLISSLVMAAVFTAYISNQKVHDVQKQIVEMQQNIRAGGGMILREIKLAGYDPEGKSGADIYAAFPDAIAFSMDLNADDDTADAGENIAYDRSTTINGTLALGRAVSPNQINVALNGADHWEANGHQPAAENIEALEFLYTLDDGTQTTQPAPANYDRIESITLSILARSPFPDQEYTNNIQYTAASGNAFALSGANPPNDNFRRRLVTHTIRLRNMGL